MLFHRRNQPAEDPEFVTQETEHFWRSHLKHHELNREQEPQDFLFPMPHIKQAQNWSPEGAPALARVHSLHKVAPVLRASSTEATPHDEVDSDRAHEVLAQRMSQIWSPRTAPHWGDFIPHLGGAGPFAGHTFVHIYPEHPDVVNIHTFVSHPDVLGRKHEYPDLEEDRFPIETSTYLQAGEHGPRLVNERFRVMSEYHGHTPGNIGLHTILNQLREADRLGIPEMEISEDMENYLKGHGIPLRGKGLREALEKKVGKGIHSFMAQVARRTLPAPLEVLANHPPAGIYLPAAPYGDSRAVDLDPRERRALSRNFWTNTLAAHEQARRGGEGRPSMPAQDFWGDLPVLEHHHPHHTLAYQSYKMAERIGGGPVTNPWAQEAREPQVQESQKTHKSRVTAMFKDLMGADTPYESHTPAHLSGAAPFVGMTTVVAGDPAHIRRWSRPEMGREIPHLEMVSHVIHPEKPDYDSQEMKGLFSPPGSSTALTKAPEPVVTTHNALIRTSAGPLLVNKGFQVHPGYTGEHAGNVGLHVIGHQLRAAQEHGFTHLVPSDEMGDFLRDHGIDVPMARARYVTYGHMPGYHFRGMSHRTRYAPIAVTPDDTPDSIAGQIYDKLAPVHEFMAKATRSVHRRPGEPPAGIYMPPAPRGDSRAEGKEKSMSILLPAIGKLPPLRAQADMDYETMSRGGAPPNPPAGWENERPIHPKYYSPGQLLDLGYIDTRTHNIMVQHGIQNLHHLRSSMSQRQFEALPGSGPHPSLIVRQAMHKVGLPFTNEREDELREIGLG